MSERFDYEQQESEDRMRQEEEAWAEALRLNRLIEEHRRWLAEFKSQEKVYA